MKQLLKSGKGEKGQSLVEFALILPVLLLIIMGIIQYGFYFSARIAVTNAAREGARVAAVGTTEGVVKTRVLEEVYGHPFLNISNGNISVAYPTKVGDKVTVAITGSSVDVIAPIPGIFVPNGTIPVGATAYMRLEKLP